MTLRKRTAQMLEHDSSKAPKYRLINFALLILIILNVIAITLESVKTLHAEYHALFWKFEVFSVIIFTIEYLARVWCSVEQNSLHNKSMFAVRIKYMLSPMALVDLIAILPFFLGLYVTMDLRFLRVLRLLRLFKLTRYSPALGALLDVIYKESGALLSALVILLTMLVISASGIHLLEGDIQPDVFGSIPDAMWWSIITLTTVGYGDVAPITPFGKLFGGFIGLIGVGMVALPAAILASGFAQSIGRRKSKYTKFIQHILSDGKIDEVERWQMEELRKELGLEPEEALRLLDRMMRKSKPKEEQICPHCGESLNLKTKKNG